MTEEERLPGGNTGGAVRVGSTVRRTAGPWTPSVHALLRHLEAAGFAGAPRALGFDDRGREMLSYLPGEVVGTTRPWPAWVHSDDALDQVGRWVRDFHRAAADFVPAPGATWREGGEWAPGLVIGHNDAAPYNATWSNRRLIGFFDWDFAGRRPAIPRTKKWSRKGWTARWKPRSASWTTSPASRGPSHRAAQRLFAEAGLPHPRRLIAEPADDR